MAWNSLLCPLYCNSGGLSPVLAMTVHLPPLPPCSQSLSVPAGAGRSALPALLKAAGLVWWGRQADGEGPGSQCSSPTGKQLSYCLPPFQKGHFWLVPVKLKRYRILIIGDLGICLFTDWHWSIFMYFVLLAQLSNSWKATRTSVRKICSHKYIWLCLKSAGWASPWNQWELVIGFRIIRAYLEWGY